MTGSGSSRRRFIAGAGATAVAVATWGVVALRSEPWSELSRRLRELFDDPSALEPFGRRTVAAGEGGLTRDAVAAELAELVGWPDAAAGPEVAVPPLEQLASTLAAAIQSDFVAGDTVLVDGWLLSRTEQRLVALVGLGRS